MLSYANKPIIALVVMLNVDMLSVILSSVVAPFKADIFLLHRPIYKFLPCFHGTMTFGISTLGIMRLSITIKTVMLSITSIYAQHLVSLY
jgi:hypothetical protein